MINIIWLLVHWPTSLQIICTLCGWSSETKFKLLLRLLALNFIFLNFKNSWKIIKITSVTLWRKLMGWQAFFKVWWQSVHSSNSWGSVSSGKYSLANCSFTIPATSEQNLLRSLFISDPQSDKVLKNNLRQWKICLHVSLWLRKYSKKPLFWWLLISPSKLFWAGAVEMISQSKNKCTILI